MAQCKAIKYSGEQCKRGAMQGLTVCASHGGSAPRAKAKSERAKLVKQIEREFERLEVTPVGDPLRAFADLTSETVAFKDWLADRVAQLKGDIRYDGAAGEQLRAEVALYERAMDRAGKFLTDWVRLGLDERMVRVDERRIQLLEQVVRSFITDDELALSEQQRLIAPRVFSRHLKVLEA